ncbi:MAG: 2'-5' RNA ligase family protein [Aquabacterium sp.]|uniref:2'-5' RNA ligase family protein n=1 Tax=Aquabacterium sp. TaxID=1872578 RepID=UPI0025C4B225|nr:2'-5' RNA ligase family protein [Aquabacterium sp.]MBI5924560.1 2'-5' RNA ligase family protein [Aquabacterium sp.]
MSEQMSLDGFASGGDRVNSLFLALMPDGIAAQRAKVLAQDLGQQQRLAFKPERATRFHVTLFHVGSFLGDIPPATLTTVRQVAQGMAVAPFEVAFDKVGSFKGKPGRIPIVLFGATSSELMGFQADLDQKMMRAGLTRGDHLRQFKPHLTLFYGRTDVPERCIETVSWQATEFVLLRSLVGQGVYIEEGRWPMLKAQ